MTLFYDLFGLLRAMELTLLKFHMIQIIFDHYKVSNILQINLC